MNPRSIQSLENGYSHRRRNKFKRFRRSTHLAECPAEAVDPGGAESDPNPASLLFDLPGHIRLDQVTKALLGEGVGLVLETGSEERVSPRALLLPYPFTAPAVRPAT